MIKRMKFFQFCFAAYLLVNFLTNAHAGKLTSDMYLDKVHGAWLGKCIGGALGMPLEGWHYQDIDRKFPVITGYTGYFGIGWYGWSGFLSVLEIPKDGNWHKLKFTVKIPGYNTGLYFPSPIIGMSYEHSTNPGNWEISNIEILTTRNTPAFSKDSWSIDASSAWLDSNVVRMNFAGERCWIKLSSGFARELEIKPDDELLISFYARHISGDSKIGLALDYYTNGKQKGFGPDDDTSYQIVGLHSLETYGPDLSAKQIGKDWCALLPGVSNVLAEGLALERMKNGIEPPESGVHKIGEAIGGQMKGEIWGLVCPGRPDLAVEYARRDGVVAHYRNGVYGEQFIAAMISASFNENNISKLIRIGLGKIPSDSQYTKVINEVITWHKRYPDWKDTRGELIAKYPHPCDPVYADAGVVALALLYGNGDFEKSIKIAAKCGSDTDCNTATVGALLGCIYGEKNIPSKWKDPVNDTFRCSVKGMENWSILQLSKRICTAGDKVQKYHGKKMRFTSEI